MYILIAWTFQFKTSTSGKCWVLMLQNMIKYALTNIVTFYHVSQLIRLLSLYKIICLCGILVQSYLLGLVLLRWRYLFCIHLNHRWSHANNRVVVSPYQAVTVHWLIWLQQQGNNNVFVQNKRLKICNMNAPTSSTMISIPFSSQYELTFYQQE